MSDHHGNCAPGSRYERGANGVRRYWLTFPVAAPALGTLGELLTAFAPGGLPKGAPEIWRTLTKARGGACRIELHLQRNP